VTRWAAGAIYAVGQVNFLFDRTQDPHSTADQLAHCLDVVETTMANKAALINKTLDASGGAAALRDLPRGAPPRNESWWRPRSWSGWSSGGGWSRGSRSAQ
jgi:hypothetical protein